MKQIKLIIPICCFFFMGFLATAQTAQTAADKTVKKELCKTDAKCDVTKCASMVKAGLCTPKQALECLKNGKGTNKASVKNVSDVKVASVSKQRGTDAKSSSKVVKKKSCSSTCGSKKKAGI